MKVVLNRKKSFEKLIVSASTFMFRLVTLTEEKLQSELARQTAEHQVKELLKRIDSEVSATLRFVFCRLRLKAYVSL